MTHTFTLTLTTATTDETKRATERARLANAITDLTEGMITDRPTFGYVETIHLSTPDALISISMDRDPHA